MTETIHDVDFTFVEPDVGGMEIPMDPKWDDDEKLDCAYTTISEAFPTYEDIEIVKIKDTGIGEE